jgi:3-oxoacyl-[acyl-carrier-protein] synthase III
MTSILAIAGALPANEVTNADLARAHPEWRMDLIAELTGVHSRRIAAEDETAFDLSVRACELLVDRQGVDLAGLDAILYCTHEPDHRTPGNSQLLHAHLGLGDDVLAFDYRLACSGFVYGLAIADALGRAGTASEILLVTAETQSKRINPRDRSTRALFGDGAAATLLSAKDEAGGRIVACKLCTHGGGFQYAYVPAGGARNPSSEETRQETTDGSGNVRTPEEFHMAGVELWGFVSSQIPAHIESFMAEHSLTLDEVDLCVFHQASKLVLDSLAKALGIPAEKLFVEMENLGNLSSASVPFALEAALARGAIRPGDRVLVSAFGVGISYGSAILQF